MRKQVLLVVACVALVAGTVQADIGSISLTANITTTPASLDVDFDLQATTAGATNPTVYYDIFRFIAQLYYPYTGTTTSTYDLTTFARPSAGQSSFSQSWTLTAPFFETWGWWAWFGGVNVYSCNYPTPNGGACYFSSVQSVYGVTDILSQAPPTPTPGGPTATPDLSGAVPVPTMSTLGMVLMGVLLAGIGLLVLRRNS